MANKVPVVVRKDYVIYLELFNKDLWFHTDIYKWTPQVKRNFTKDGTALLELVGVQVNALVTEDNKKLEKFIKTFNWFYKCQVGLKDGSRANVYASKKHKGE